MVLLCGATITYKLLTQKGRATHIVLIRYETVIVSVIETLQKGSLLLKVPSFGISQASFHNSNFVIAYRLGYRNVHNQFA